MMRSLLIANRGEIACRIIRTARGLGVRSVAVFSDADRHALHVREADEAVHIGASAARESYLVGEKIIAAAKETGAEAIHPGYGFLSENAEFAEAVEAAGLIWVGPPPSAIRAMGLKDAAKSLMIAAGVPVTPGYLGEDQAPARLQAEADAIGWPVLIKAVAGGGGKGMRRVDASAEFQDMLASCKREAAAAFGDDRVLIEKYILRPRHIEVQVFGDTHGNVVHLFERDCSLQRRHQKVIEEAPSSAVSPALRRRMGEAAVRAAAAVGYTNAGTCEFLLAPDGEFYFLEMNTRLQVEHTVTEMVTGLDIVALQIGVAMGESIAGLSVEPRGAAIECRINAEDPGRNFMPGPGRITRYEEPAGPFVRVDAGFGQGREIPGDYDSMFAKLVVSGTDRDQARRRMLRALGEFVVEGVPTTIPALRWVLESKEFRTGAHTTTWAERALAEADLPAQADLGPSGQGTREGRPADILVEVDGRRVPVRVFDERRDVAPKPPEVHDAAHQEHVHGEVRADMQGTIVKVLVEKGQDIRAGEVLCILEAMKMENHIAATRDGEVTDLPTRAGQVVETGQVLAVID